ncbi:hypothetical protein ACHAPJ_002391 [Fusarium lateritium]
MGSPTRTPSPDPKKKDEKNGGIHEMDEKEIREQLVEDLRSRDGLVSLSNPSVLAIPRRTRLTAPSQSRAKSSTQKPPKGRLPAPPREARPTSIPQAMGVMPAPSWDTMKPGPGYDQPPSIPNHQPPPPGLNPPMPYPHQLPPASPKQVLTHYTISEDAIGASSRDKLAAIDYGPGVPSQMSPGGKMRAPVQPGPPMPAPPNIINIVRPVIPGRGNRIPTINKITKDHSDAQLQSLGPAAIPRTPSPSGPSDLSAFTPVSGQAQPYLGAPVAEKASESYEPFGTGATPIESLYDGLEGEDSSYQADLMDTNILQTLIDRVKELEQENEKLREDVDTFSTTSANSPINVQFFHCLERAGSDDDSYEERSNRTVYLTPPEWEIFGEDIDLKGRFPIANPEDYAEEHDAALVIHKYYSVDHQYDSVNAARRAKLPLPEPEPASQDIVLASKEMVEAVEALFDQFPSFSDDFPSVFEMESLKDPHLWWYHCRTTFKIQDLPDRQAQLVAVLIDWIESNFAQLYDQIDDQFRRGKVSSESLKFLIRPGDVLVAKRNGTYSGRIATGRPLPQAMDKRSEETEKNSERLGDQSWVVRTRSYGYAGKFFRVDKEVSIDFPSKYSGTEIDISELNTMPLSYAKPEVKETLLQRGKRFWKLRDKQLISYEGNSSHKIQKLHPGSNYVGQVGYVSARKTNLPADDSEPEDPEIYLFPEEIPGFDLRRKKWVDLEVDRIRDVTWNKQAFRSLVADEDMKELVLALVTNQLDAEKNTDLIESKGSGLILLLHGSPGTGKTFTAESVAEIAKKPLYPVTCGDIGTEPEDVEKYLESVFHLGKIWDCVVLLDEAEVFLEQRTLQDLKRNALVSVFLRALEYYEGILILTTNRVGTFDEAFKSRIQLALRYEKLKDYQRKQIWKNFLGRLRGLGEDESIDFDNIELYLDDLAQYPMNGRQIRNSITTGRQLAKYKQRKMTFSHLKRAIDVADKFDRYLADVQEGDMEEYSGRGENGRYSPEYLARVDQIR